MRGAYKAPAPAPAFRFKVKGGARISGTYDRVVRDWRAGVISDFYCGTRADDDPTVVWLIDGAEYLRDDTAGVLDRLAELERRAGVADISWGPFWCGYRELVVTFTNGASVTQHYNGTAVVESVTPANARRAVAS